MGGREQREFLLVLLCSALSLFTTPESYLQNDLTELKL